MSALREELDQEIKKRRTFAIISHPDAGKTTLTEKLLLYGGAIHLAGSIKSRKTQRHAVSDWMEIEKQRGISVTSSVLQFDYAGCRINILDTPGHQDFSEDTYRTLMAVDSAVMVIDVAKGVEAQTKKLFKVCKQRGIPIFTFINKLATKRSCSLPPIRRTASRRASPMSTSPMTPPSLSASAKRRGRPSKTISSCSTRPARNLTWRRSMPAS